MRPSPFAKCWHSGASLSELCKVPLETTAILENMPKSVIDLSAIVIESDGSEVTAALAALSLALVHAGKPHSTRPASC